MTESKLVICYIGQDVEQFIKMSLDSIKDIADTIVFVDGGSTDNTINILREKYNFAAEGDTLHVNKPGTYEFNRLINRPYDKEDKGGNGKARNCYLDFVKKNYPDWWCLVLDPDEIVSNTQNIKDIIKQVGKKYPNKNVIFNPHMRHLITYLNQEDSTLPLHFCPGRFFKVTDDLYYNEIEHPVLQCRTQHFRGALTGFTIWHIAYISHVFNIRQRYINNIKKSDMHSELQLDDWYFAHITGLFAKKEFNINELPEQVKKYFFIDRMEQYTYYSNRRDLEVKHFIMSKQFLTVINKKPRDISILDIGAGMGLFGHVMQYLGVKDYLGIEKSKYAVNNTNYKDLKIIQGDVTRELKLNKKFDLILCLDILEHLAYKDLDNALKNIAEFCGDKIIFCTPYKNDPDCHIDKTHIIKEEKEWWIEKITKYFNIKDAPKDWEFQYKILIGEKE